MRKLFIPLVAFLLFISESMFVNILSGELSGDKIFVPRFLMIFLVFLSVYSYPRTAMWYSFFIGLAFDIVYTEILGIYLAIFPIITYVMTKTMKILQNNIFVVSLMALFAVAIVETIAFGVYFILGIGNLPFQEFLSIRLVPTLILNAIAIAILAYPLKQKILKYDDENSSETLFRKRS